MPPLVSVLVPTHDHAELLPYALESIRSQSFTDFEILLVGDGASDATVTVVEELLAVEPRLRWFPHPKGPRIGEAYRHRLILDEARGEVIAYLTDDDLWFPDHLETVVRELSASDFVGTWSVRVRPDQVVEGLVHDLSDETTRKTMLEGFNSLPLASGAHTAEAYRRLPHGWRTTPPGIYTDLYMWQQWLQTPALRMTSITWPTQLSFTDAERKKQPIEQRRLELATWAERVRGEPTSIRRAALAGLAPRGQVEAARRHAAELEAVIADLRRQLAEAATRIEDREHDVKVLTEVHEHYVAHVARIEAELEASRSEAAALRSRRPLRGRLRGIARSADRGRGST